MSSANGKKLPEGWALASLGAISEDSVQQTDPEGADEFIYVDIASIDNRLKQIVSPKLLPISEAPSRAKQRLRAGDVLVSMTRPNLNAVAKVQGALDGAVGSTGFHVLRTPWIEPAWIFYSVQSSTFVDAMCEVVQGALYPAVRPKDVRAFLIPLPPRSEQTRIADALDELFSELDAAVAALKRVREKLKLYRASVLKAAVEGSLTADWRAEHPHVEPASELLKRILIERRRRWEEEQLRNYKDKGKQPPKNWKEKYKEPVAPDTTGLPELPEGWRWTNLGECFRVQVGATPSRTEPQYWNGDVAWVASGEVQFCRITNTREKITDLALRNCSTTLNPVGSVILNMIGEGRTRGKAGILDIAACNNQNCAAIWVSQTPIPTLYVYYWLLYQYEQTRELGSGNNQPAMNKTIVEGIPIPLPPLIEQETIIEVLDDQMSIIDHLEADLEAQFTSAQALRQSILRHAFSGKLVPQDPNDEPASELLKRIAVERESKLWEAAEAKKNGKSNGKHTKGTGRGRKPKAAVQVDA